MSINHSNWVYCLHADRLLFSTIFSQFQPFNAMHLGVHYKQLLPLGCWDPNNQIRGHWEAESECLIDKLEIYFSIACESNGTPQLCMWKLGKTRFFVVVVVVLSLWKSKPDSFSQSSKHCSRSRARALRDFLPCISECFSALFSLNVICKETRVPCWHIYISLGFLKISKVTYL